MLKATAGMPTSGTRERDHTSVEPDHSRSPIGRQTPGEPTQQGGRRFTSHPTDDLPDTTNHPVLHIQVGASKRPSVREPCAAL